MSEIGILSAPPGGYGLFAEPDTQLGRGGSEWNVRENFNTTFPPTNRNLYCWNVFNQFCLFTVNFIVAKLVLEITSWHMQFYPQSFSDQMLKDCGRLQRNWGLAAKNDFFKLARMPSSPSCSILCPVNWKAYVIKSDNLFIGVCPVFWWQKSESFVFANLSQGSQACILPTKLTPLG